MKVSEATPMMRNTLKQVLCLHTPGSQQQIKNTQISNTRMGVYRCHIHDRKTAIQPVYGAGKGLYCVVNVLSSSPAKASCASTAV
jgi:hypothetical protein